MNIQTLINNNWDFKVVEINNSVALRAGHIIAQAPLKKINYLATNANVGTEDGAAEYLENGYILYLDVDGELKSPIRASAAIKATQAPILHYTEELFTTGLTEQLKHFAVEWDEDDIAYPRGLVLHVGDTFTTNNFSGTLTDATLAIVNPQGAFVVYDAIGDVPAYTGPLFHVVPSTLPDGETLAAELTLLAPFVTITE